MTTAWAIKTRTGKIVVETIRRDKLAAILEKRFGSEKLVRVKIIALPPTAAHLKLDRRNRRHRRLQKQATQPKGLRK